MRKLIEDYSGLIVEIVMFIVLFGAVIKGITHMING